MPADNTRCVGRIGLGEDDPVCEVRGKCWRWCQMARDREAGLESYAGISVRTHCHEDGARTMFEPEPQA